MANGKNRKCPFNECLLPDNNKKYVIQFIYLIVSAALLATDVSQFTFFSILMFTVPIVIDLASTDSKSKVYTVIRWLFLALNLLYVAFCIAGMGGFFVDKRESFEVVNTALIFPQKVIPKITLFYVLASDLVIPVMMLFACPTKKILKVQNLATKVGRS